MKEDLDGDGSEEGEVEVEAGPSSGSRRPLTRAMTRKMGDAFVPVEYPNPSKRPKKEASQPVTFPNYNGAGVAPEEFKVILKERSAEMKELQRQAEARRSEVLEKMKRDLEDAASFNPLERFPREVWVEILDRLSAKDLSNMWESHSIFRDLLEKNRLRDILLPQALNLKTGFIKSQFQPPIYYSRMNTPNQLQLLNLRLVSKSVRDAIDEWFEDELLRNMRSGNGTNTTFKKCIKLELTYDFDLLEKMLEIKRPMKIIGRELTVIVPSEYYLMHPFEEAGEGAEAQNLNYMDYFTVFTNNVTQVLQEVGDQLWRFSISCWSVKEMETNGFSHAQLYLLLRSWLILLPNVKWIELYLREYEFAQGQISELDQDILQSQPAPTLEALERLDFRGEDVFKFCDAIVAANPHIKIFNYGGSDFEERIREPSIQALRLESFRHIRGHRYSTGPLTVIHPIVNPNLNRWNLKVMDVNFNRCPVKEIFEFLNQFPTVELMKLDIGRVDIEEEIPFLMLPNLKDFRIKFLAKTGKYNMNTHFFFSLQFLLYSKNLKSVNWISSGNSSHFGSRIRKYGHPKGMIDFSGGFKDLSLSNIWNVFPQLQSIKVEYEISQRDEGKKKTKRPRPGATLFRKKYMKGKLVHEEKIERRFRRYCCM